MDPSKLLRDLRQGMTGKYSGILPVAYYPLHTAEYATVLLASDWLNFSRHEIKYSAIHGTIQYSTIQYSILQYNTRQYNITHYIAVKYTTIHHNIIQYNRKHCNKLHIQKEHGNKDK